MRTKGVLFFCSILTFSGYVRAEPYLLVGESDKGHHYVDIESIERVEIRDRTDVFQAWSKRSGAPGSAKKQPKTLELMYYDCETKEISLQAYADYDAEGRVTKSDDFNSIRFSRLFPESIGMTKLEFVCDFASGRKYIKKP